MIEVGEPYCPGPMRWLRVHVPWCTWVSALLQAAMKTRKALPWTHELPAMG